MALLLNIICILGIFFIDIHELTYLFFYFIICKQEFLPLFFPCGQLRELLTLQISIHDGAFDRFFRCRSKDSFLAFRTRLNYSYSFFRCRSNYSYIFQVFFTNSYSISLYFGHSLNGLFQVLLLFYFAQVIDLKYFKFCSNFKRHIEPK